MELDLGNLPLSFAFINTFQKVAFWNLLYSFYITFTINIHIILKSKLGRYVGGNLILIKRKREVTTTLISLSYDGLVDGLLDWFVCYTYDCMG